jgi:hypothetical protein
MLRPFGLFLLVFALFSFVVHLDLLGQIFGTGALCLFGIELVAVHSAKAAPPPSRMRGEPLL